MPAAIDTAPVEHAWIARCHRREATGMVLCPSAAGVAALHGMGRAAWIAQLSSALGLKTPPDRWRLLDDCLDRTPAQIDALLAAPRPRDPAVLDDTRSGDHATVLSLRVPLDLAQLDDHFVTAPVLPGFMQVGWALALAASRLHTPPACSAIEALKFQQFLRPGDAVELQLRREPTDGKLHFAYRQGPLAYSSGRFVFEHAHG